MSKVSELLKRYEKGTNEPTLSPKGSMIIRERSSSTFVRERAQSILIQANKREEYLKKDFSKNDNKKEGTPTQRKSVFEHRDSKEFRDIKLDSPKLQDKEIIKETEPPKEENLKKEDNEPLKENVKPIVPEPVNIPLIKPVEEPVSLQIEKPKEQPINIVVVKPEVEPLKEPLKIEEQPMNVQKIVIVKPEETSPKQEIKKFNEEKKEEPLKQLTKIDTKSNLSTPITDLGGLSPKYPTLPNCAFPINKPAIVLYDFIAEYEDEVTIAQNDQITVILYDKDWSWISLGYEQGNIPSSYFILKEDIEKEKKKEEDLIKEQKEKEQKEKERIEKEILDKEKKEKEEKERVEKEKVDKERLEKEKLAKELKEKELKEKELKENEEKEKREKELKAQKEKELKEKQISDKKDFDDIKIAIAKDPQLSTKDLKNGMVSPSKEASFREQPKTLEKKESNRNSIFFKLFPLSKKDKKEQQIERQELFDKRKTLIIKEKKECEYGINCNRKNPQHWIEYKHSILETKSPNPKSPRDVEIEELKEENQNLKLKLLQCEELINTLEKKLKEVVNEDFSDLKKDKELVRKKSLILKELKTDFDKKEDLLKQIHSIKEESTKINVKFPGYWSKGHDDQIIDVDPSSEEFLEIQNLMNSNNLKNEQLFVITSLQRVQKVSLWKSFSEKKTTITSKYNNLLQDFEDSKVLTKTVLTPCLDNQSNEFWLFHGTNEKNIPQIIKEGYDTKSMSLVGIFGSGLYLQETSFQAYPYVTCPKCGEGAIYSKDSKCSCKDDEVCTMLLFRTLLGHSHICMKYNQQKYKGIGREGKIYFSHNAIGTIQQPPIKEGSFETYDSVIGERKEHMGEFEQREYVVYDKDQLYPEYIIKFKVKEQKGLLSKLSSLVKEKK